MTELIVELQRRRSDVENTELVSKLPPENLRETDLVLGILFNGYTFCFFIAFSGIAVFIVILFCIRNAFNSVKNIFTAPGKTEELCTQKIQYTLRVLMTKWTPK